MTIQPIVEGHGEVDAVPELLRRLVAQAGYPDIQILRAIRSHRADLVRQVSLDRVIQVARTRNPDAILILLDGDDDPCPGTLAQQLNAWAKVSAAPIQCEVVVAHREYEAWFLGAMESLRGKRGVSDDAESDVMPETPRDAKGRLSSKMVAGRFYVETSDQVALTSLFEMQSAYRASRSFRKMVNVFGGLAAAGGVVLPIWPPADWVTAAE
jgi:Domain of unknown function (DUF4276)